MDQDKAVNQEPENKKLNELGEELDKIGQKAQKVIKTQETVQTTPSQINEAVQEKQEIPSQTPQETQPPPEPEKSKESKPVAKVAVILLIISLIAVGAYFLLQRNTQTQQSTPESTPTSTPTPTLDPTAAWEIYTSDEYSFRYPKGLKSDTGAAGQGFESIRVQYTGEEQTASGRTETSLFDGYSFVVTKVSSDTTKTAQQQAQEERANSEENCDSDQSTLSSVTQIQMAGVNASQYSVTECFGDYTSSYLVNNGNLFRITQLYVGEESEKQEYKATTDQILSTFEFTEEATPSATSSPSANLPQ